MLKDLKWDSVERAYANMSEEYKPEDYLVMLIKPNNDVLKRRNITVEHFKVAIWHLYNDEKRFDEVAVVDPNGENSVVFHYGSRRHLDEGMPTTGDGSNVKFWRTFDKNRREALLQILTSQIHEDNDARIE